MFIRFSQNISHLTQSLGLEGGRRSSGWEPAPKLDKLRLKMGLKEVLVERKNPKGQADCKASRLTCTRSRCSRTGNHRHTCCVLTVFLLKEQRQRVNTSHYVVYRVTLLPKFQEVASPHPWLAKLLSVISQALQAKLGGTGDLHPPINTDQLWVHVRPFTYWFWYVVHTQKPLDFISLTIIYYITIPV